MFKKILSLLLITCLLNTLVGCGINNPILPEEEGELKDIILAQVNDPESNILVLGGMENDEAVMALGEKNEDGTAKKITGVFYTNGNGESFLIELGDNCLPVSLVDSNGTKVIYSNYTDSTVEINIYDSTDNLITGPVVEEIDSQQIKEIQQLCQSIKSETRDAAEIAEIFRAAGLIVSVFCGVVVVIFGAPEAAAVAAISLLITFIASITEDEADNIVILGYGVASCSNPLGCIGVAIGGIGLAIDIINQSEEILTPEEIELIREWGYGGDYVVRWPDGYVDVYDATNYSQMQGILNQWNAAIGGPVILRLSSNPNCPVKVIFDSNIGQEGYCWNACNQEGDDYTFSEVMIKINYDESFCGYPNTTYTAYLCAFNAVAGFNYWAEVSLTPFDDWNNFNTIPDTIKTMVHALYKVSPGYYLGDSKQWKNCSNAIIKNIFKSGGGSYLDSDRK